MAGFISYQKKGDYEYASWCRAYRDPNEKSRSRSPKHHVIYYRLSPIFSFNQAQDRGA